MPSASLSVKPTDFRRDIHFRVEDMGFETPCWVWLRAKSAGYARVAKGGTSTPVHRVVWEATNGSIPGGAHIHHRCEVPSCVNPEHLELLTPAEHLRRHRSVATTCTKGHVYDEANTATNIKGRRVCLACKRERELQQMKSPPGVPAIARNIRFRRRALDITQRDLANDLGVPDMTVSRWERGLNEPSTPHLRALAKRFECTLDDLLDEKETAA